MTPRAVLLTSTGVRGRNVARACRAVGAEVEVVSTPDELLQACQSLPHVVIVDGGDDMAGETIHDAFLELAGSPVSSRTILLSDLTTREAFIDLLKADLLHHLIASSAPKALDRLTLTVAQLLFNEPLGVQRFVPWGTQIHGFVLTRSETKSEVLSRFAEYAEIMRIPSRLATLARSVCDEFIMNALYDAPTDRKGRYLFADRPRNEPIELPDGNRARFRFCCTGSSLVVSILDPYGSLTPDVVRKNLLRTLSGGQDQLRSDSAGAGVGLYMAFRALSDWIINIVPGKATEMIGMIRTSGTYRDHIAMPKSFHIFCADAR